MNKIIITNWKMKMGGKETLDLVKQFKEQFQESDFNKLDVVVCPSFVVLNEVKKALKGSKIKLGAQNVFWEEQGAYTGEISTGMIKEAGCEYVIIGHSERRRHLLENYEMIHLKIEATLNQEELTPVVCIGEETKERDTGKRDFIIINQLQEAFGGIRIAPKDKIIVVYEPAWAISTFGAGAIEPKEAEYAHKITRLALNDMFGMGIVNEHFRIIYGGSVDSKNVKDLIGLENVDGVLVGRASLDTREFYRIAKIVLK